MSEQGCLTRGVAGGALKKQKLDAVTLVAAVKAS